MIFGVGTDLIETERVKKACERESFLKRTFTEKERELFAGHPQKAAGNFAVKEAVVKAFGTGFGKISPMDIEVLREESGRPYVILYGPAKAFQTEHKITGIHISISNTKEYATAYVVMETE